MKRYDMQDDLEIIGIDEEIDLLHDDSPYYHHPDYPEFDGWRDLVW